jgi:hypothetical protein
MDEASGQSQAIRVKLNQAATAAAEWVHVREIVVIAAG